MEPAAYGLEPALYFYVIDAALLHLVVFFRDVVLDLGGGLQWIQGWMDTGRHRHSLGEWNKGIVPDPVDVFMLIAYVLLLDRVDRLLRLIVVDPRRQRLIR